MPFAEGVVACPIDGLALSMQGSGALVCAAGHSFDRAREGYYNLLVVQHKASRDPGDSKPMVAARRRVLDSGLYAPIAECVCDAVTDAARSMPLERPLRVLDAGCGEGSYLVGIGERLACEGIAAHLAGLDISKWAVQAAAKRTSGAFWAVGTNRHVPFAPHSLDVIICMFGFPVWAAFAGALAPGGRVIMVDPGPDHLIEMRSIIYPDVQRQEATHALAAAATRAGFEVVSHQQAMFAVAVNGKALIGELLAMTPHDHRAPQAGRDALGALERLELTADIVVRQLIIRTA